MAMQSYRIVKHPPTWGQWLTRKAFALGELVLAVIGVWSLMPKA